MNDVVRSPIDLTVLPALPGVAREILLQFNDEFVTGKQVADTVQKDPGITARLVSIANSAYFGLPNPVTDMDEIVIRVLGVDNVRALALAMVASQVLEIRSCGNFDLREFWVRAFLGGESARLAAYEISGCDDRDRSMAYTAGFCRDIGLLAFVAIAPTETARILAIPENAGDPLPHENRQAMFRQQFGLTPEEATATLARQWGMPEAMSQAYAARADGDDTVPLSHALQIVEDVLHSLFDADSAPAAANDPNSSLVRAATPKSAYTEQVSALVANLT